MTNTMRNSEEIVITGLSIMVYVGDARGNLVEVLESAKNRNFDETRQLVKEIEKSIGLAHDAQAKILIREANGENVTLSFIMAYGQDILMTTVLLRDQMDTILDLYKRVFVLGNR